MTELEKKQRVFNVLFLVLAIIIAAAITGGSVALYDRFSQTNDRRAAQASLNQRFREHDARQTAAIRSILCLAERSVILDKNETPDQKAKALDFYSKALKLIQAEPCAIKGGTP